MGDLSAPSHGPRLAGLERTQRWWLSTMGHVEGRQLKVAGYEGKVVAVDRETGTVVASADTPQELMSVLRLHHFANTMIIRVPGVDEPLRVGLG